MEDKNIFDDKKEINPFSDVAKSPIETPRPADSAEFMPLAANESIPVESPKSPDPIQNTEDADLFLQSILGDQVIKESTPSPQVETPAESDPPTKPILDEVAKSAEFENLIDMNNDSGYTESLDRPDYEKRTTTMQDIVPSDKLKDLPSSGAQKPASGKKMLIIGGVVAVVIVVAYLFSTSQKNSTPSVTQLTTEGTPVANEFASDTQRKNDLGKIKAALIKYKQAKNAFPKADSVVFLSEPGNTLSSALVPSYLDLLPSDPDPSRKYGYKSDDNDFTLTAVLDNSNDSTVTIENGLSLYKITSNSEEKTDTNTGSATQSVLENQGGDYVFEP